jgi:hypothetical protein
MLTAWAALASAASVASAAAAARPAVIRDGPARFEVLTPSLIRLEYAQDGRFQNAPTMTAVRARRPAAGFTTRVAGGWRVIRTRLVTLRYRRGSGRFSPANLRLTLAVNRRRITVTPSAGASSGNLGGWTRALDLQTGPVPLHDGLLSTAGWYVLDDTATVLLTRGSPGFAARPAHAGAYQDWYLFAYGHDYARGLGDLRALTGPAPLLPRSAFGVWFSRYYPYSESEYHTLLAQFRSAQVPLDTLSVDTDFKRENDPVLAAVAATIAGAPGRPYSWNGWEWDPALFPDPKRFIDWAHGQGLSLTINIHPSIDTNDPRWPETQARAGSLVTDVGQCKLLQADLTGQCKVFDWTDPRQLGAYFALHAPFEQQGIDFFWLDWCCDASGAVAPGLSSDTWINSRYAQRERARGLRWLAFSRIGAAFGPVSDGDRGTGDGGVGAFAEHRYTIQFTGDTCATWSMLAFEAQLAASEGNVGLPYVSDDIGSFNGAPVAGQCSAGTGLLSEQLPDDLYARWVQFGTFQPLDRLHSNHGQRLPWQYGPAAAAAAADFLRLREALDPYTYTLARRAYDTGLPITGGLYLQWPQLAAAYRHPAEYTFGRDLVVAPVTSPGNPAPASVWIPPGTWIDYFTGQRYTGPSVESLSVPLARMPLLVRAGAIVPTQPYTPSTPPGPSRALTLTAFPGARGSFTLYDDAGVGFGYVGGQHAFTRIAHAQRRRWSSLTIGAARGRFPGAPSARSWRIRFLSVARPRIVRIDGHRIAHQAAAGRSGWSWDPARRTLTVNTGPVSTGRTVAIAAGG